MNKDSTLVTFGETAASGEMCMSIGYYFPAGQPTTGTGSGSPIPIATDLTLLRSGPRGRLTHGGPLWKARVMPSVASIPFPRPIPSDGAVSPLREGEESDSLLPLRRTDGMMCQVRLFLGLAIAAVAAQGCSSSSPSPASSDSGSGSSSGGDDGLGNGSSGNGSGSADEAPAVAAACP